MNGFSAPRRDSFQHEGSRIEYQMFRNDYFTGSDVKLYFGDIFIDEVIGIDFNLQEEVLPIYGYNSYTYDTIARGKRIVQGSLSLNFVNVNYLHEVIKNAHAIEYAIQKGEKSKRIRPEYYESMRLDEILNILGKESFEQIAEEYENEIWGAERNEYQEMPYFQNDDIGFDIRIQYGPIEETKIHEKQGFYETFKKSKQNNTVEVINGVQFNTYSKGISTNMEGQPLTNQYTFIARDINGLSSSRLIKETEFEGSGTTSRQGPGDNQMIRP